MTINSSSNSSSDSPEREGDLAIQENVKTPRMYQVLMHNDDYTTMEFVIHVLQKFFQKSPDEAYDIMLSIHNDGIGLCGIYTKEIAESKSIKVIRYARGKGHPLKTSIEPCES
jgi:ATP-dependent Clp protease adaptor protein ClpS